MTIPAVWTRTQPFVNHREAALALFSRVITRDVELEPWIAEHVGRCCAFEYVARRDVWILQKLLAEYDLPSIEEAG